MQSRRTLTPCLRRSRRGRQVTLSLLRREKGTFGGTVFGSPNRDPRRVRSSSPLPARYVFSVAAGILPAVEPGILPGGKGVWLEKSLPLRTSGPGGKMPPSTAAKMAAATDVNLTLNTYPARSGEIKVRGASDCILTAQVRPKANSNARRVLTWARCARNSAEA